MRTSRPAPVAAAFGDLKRGLATVSAAEWAALPEAGDRKAKRPRLPDRITAMPDAMALAAAERYAVPTGGAVGGGGGGLGSAGGGGGGSTDLAQVGAGRSSMLSQRLDRAGAATPAGRAGGGATPGGAPSVDPAGYLTDLASVAGGGRGADASGVGDLRKARSLLRSVTGANPTYAAGWIAAARLEEAAGRHAEARAVASRGCAACPREEEMWLETARLRRGEPLPAGGGAGGVGVATPGGVTTTTTGGGGAATVVAPAAGAATPGAATAAGGSVGAAAAAAAAAGTPPAAPVFSRAGDDAAKRVLASAVRHLPRSVRIWLAAAALEAHPPAARRVLRKALELIPSSARLWRAAVEREPPASARPLLATAVECVPGAVDLWLALAAASPPVDARGVLNRARAACPAERAVWLAAARLEEGEARAAARLAAAGGGDACGGGGGGDAAAANGGAAAPPPGGDRVAAVVAKGVTTLSVAGSLVSRAEWLAEAVVAERAGYPWVAAALVAAALPLGVEAADRRARWAADAAAAEAAPPSDAAALAAAGAPAAAVVDGASGEPDASSPPPPPPDGAAVPVGVVRAMHAALAGAFPAKADVWLSWAEFEARVGGRATATAAPAATAPTAAADAATGGGDGGGGDAGASPPTAGVLPVLGRAVRFCPTEPTLWLMAAKAAWAGGANPAAARSLLARAVAANEGAAELWLAAAKVEAAAREWDRGRALLRRAADAVPSARVYMKAALLEREYGAAWHTRRRTPAAAAAARALLATALSPGSPHPRLAASPPLYLALAAAHAAAGAAPAAAAVLARGVQAVPASEGLRLAAADLAAATSGAAAAEAAWSRAAQALAPAAAAAAAAASAAATTAAMSGAAPSGSAPAAAVTVPGGGVWAARAPGRAAASTVQTLRLVGGWVTEGGGWRVHPVWDLMA
ncbi:hypothetical protein I4F81_006305 [Pyropia yezoensis]|uniref:Uncharacterized protein n=1 Tax=Pyropia yezoensis TaxID=2788 RepID=A0ACC3C1X1_PYRYE|nr:hypothetical protein I4F81_006305 [Neopyropia yezoensis]